MVKHCLEGRIGRERRTTQVVDLRARLDHNPLSREPHTPAEVNLLLMGKELLGETARRVWMALTFLHIPRL